jgi:hypothetical protein
MIEPAQRIHLNAAVGPGSEPALRRILTANV